jgi:hypothetical protein
MLHCLQAADFLSGMGLGMVADQLKELKLVQHSYHELSNYPASYAPYNV